MKYDYKKNGVEYFLKFWDKKENHFLTSAFEWRRRRYKSLEQIEMLQ